MVFQHFSLFENLTVAENVALGLPPTESFARDFRSGWRRFRAGLRPAARSQARSVAALGRRAPAHRDRARADAEPEAADPRRADLGADAAGGRPAVRDARPAQGEGRAHPLHQPQARGGQTALRHARRSCAAARSRDLRSAPRDRGVARAHDGRRRDRRSESGVRPRRDGAAARHPRPVARAATIRTARGCKDVSLEVRGGEIVGIAGVAGNGQDELFAALSGERLSRRRRHRRHRRRGRRARSASPSARRLGAAFVPEERLGHGTAPRMKLVRKRAAHRPRRERHGQAAASSTSRRRSPPSTAPPRPSTCARPSAIPEAVSLSGGNLQKFVVGREILREPGVLVVSQPTWGVDAGAAAVIRQALIDLAGARRRGAGDQPGPRRALRDRRPHRGDVPRPAVAPLDAGASATREKLGLLMGGAQPEQLSPSRRRAMQLVLERRAERSARDRGRLAADRRSR